MSANSTGQKKKCTVCNKSGGILICDGCEKTFCGKHVIDHRQELGLQLDQLMQNHDVLRQELNENLPEKNPLFSTIDQWKNASVMKILQAAETARKDLKKILDKNKDQLAETMNDLATIIRASHDADDFAENELKVWTNKLNEIQNEMKRPMSIALSENKKSSINLIEIVANSTAVSKFVTDRREEFFQKLGNVTISENFSLATHNGSGISNAFIRGKLCCSNCCYAVRFRIERCAKPYRIFFGLISSRSVLTVKTLRSPEIVGWFGFDQVYKHGICLTDCQQFGYHSKRNQVDDTITLILDDQNKEIQLINERTRTKNILLVDKYLAPAPWQFLVVLANPGDSVRLLSFY